MHRLTFILALLLIASLSGCRLGPTYEQPCECAPDEWKNSCVTPGPDTFVGDWWVIFGDPILDDLETQAICNSPTLYTALERIVEARSQSRRNPSP